MENSLSLISHLSCTNTLELTHWKWRYLFLSISFGWPLETLSLSLCTFHQLQTQHFHIHNFISLSPIQKINITPRLTLLKSQTSGTLSKQIYQVHEKRVANGEKANLNVTRAHDYPSRSQAHRFRRDCVCVFENLNGKNILILIKAFRC